MIAFSVAVMGAQRSIFFVALLLAVAGGLRAVACLPDLAEVPSDAAPGAGASVAVGRCGDGVASEGPDGSFEACDPGDAGAVGCSASCEVECDGGYVDPSSKHCYFALPQAGDELDVAIRECESRGAHVVTFAGEGEYSRVIGAALVAAPFWLGLEGSRGPEDPFRSLVPGEPGAPRRATTSCPGCFSHPNDAGSFPSFDDGGAFAGCIVARPDRFAWEEAPCVAPSSARVAIVCEREPPGMFAEPCIGGVCLYVPAVAGKKHFLYVPSRVTGEEAKNGCDSLGGRLAVVSSREERAALVRAVTQYVLRASEPRVDFWIGLASGPTVEDAFRWSDDASAELYDPVWGNDQPSGTGSRRAYLHTSLDRQYDLGLALAGAADVDGGAVDQWPYVCEY